MIASNFFVIESPMHPAALRLRIEHTLYRDPERRRHLRAGVVNDQGEHGSGLRFGSVHDEMRARLDRLMGESPILGPASDEGEGDELLKRVLTEILDRGGED